MGHGGLGRYRMIGVTAPPRRSPKVPPPQDSPSRARDVSLSPLYWDLPSPGDSFDVAVNIQGVEGQNTFAPYSAFIITK